MLRAANVRDTDTKKNKQYFFTDLELFEWEAREGGIFVAWIFVHGFC
jgi:hypothetical protein